MKERLALIGDRLIKALKATWVMMVFIILVCLFPLWIIFWVITGWDFEAWAWWFLNPEGKAEHDRLIKEIEERAGEIKEAFNQIKK